MAWLSPLAWVLAQEGIYGGLGWEEERMGNGRMREQEGFQGDAERYYKKRTI